MRNPAPDIMAPGTMKDKPQLYSTNAPATTAPTMFPMFVCAFQRPKIVPREERGNHLATTTTTAGHPVDWTTPDKSCTKKKYQKLWIR